MKTNFKIYDKNNEKKFVYIDQNEIKEINCDIDIMNPDVESLKSDLHILKEINIQNFKELDTDYELLLETNLEIENIEKELLALNSVNEIVGELVFMDQEKINLVDTQITLAQQNLETTIPILSEVSNSNSGITKLKIMGGVILGGTLLGGVGALFGIVPCIVAVGIGSGTGGLVGYFTK